MLGRRRPERHRQHRAGYSHLDRDHPGKRRAAEPDTHDPGAGHRLRRMALAGARRAAQSRPRRTREHIDVAELSGARSIASWPGRPALSAELCGDRLRAASVSSHLFEATLEPVRPRSVRQCQVLGIILCYWAIAWASIRTGASSSVLQPRIMLSIISFSLLLLQSSLRRGVNPRLRRGKLPQAEAGGRGAC